jgi:hypothetical protein
MENKRGKSAAALLTLVEPAKMALDWLGRLDLVRALSQRWGVSMTSIIAWIDQYPSLRWAISVSGGFLVAWFWRQEIESLFAKAGAAMGCPVSVEAYRSGPEESLSIEDPDYPPENHPVHAHHVVTMGLRIRALRDCMNVSLLVVGSFPQLDGVGFPFKAMETPLMIAGDGADIPLVSAGELDFPDRLILHSLNERGALLRRSVNIENVMYKTKDDGTAPDIRLDIGIEWDGPFGRRRHRRRRVTVSFWGVDDEKEWRLSVGA